MVRTIYPAPFNFAPYEAFFIWLAITTKVIYAVGMIEDAALERHISGHYGALSGHGTVTAHYLNAARTLRFEQSFLPPIIDDPGNNRGRRAEMFNRRSRVARFPTLTVVNQVTGQEASETLNVAELVMADKLPMVLAGSKESPLVIGRMAFLNLRLAEKVGIDPLHAAALTPYGLLNIADALADVTAMPEPEIEALHQMQHEITRKVAREWHSSVIDAEGTIIGDRLQLIQTAEVQVAEAYLAEEAEKRAVTFMYGHAPFAYDDEEEAYHLVDSASRGARITKEANREIAANQALRLVARLPERKLDTASDINAALEVERLTTQRSELDKSR